MVMAGNSMSWKVMEGQGRSWKVKEGQGRSRKVIEGLFNHWIDISGEKVMGRPLGL